MGCKNAPTFKVNNFTNRFTDSGGTLGGGLKFDSLKLKKLQRKLRENVKKKLLLKCVF